MYNSYKIWDKTKLYPFLRKRSVMSLVGISEGTLYRWIKQGRFPKQIKIGPNSVAWQRREIVAWMNKRRGEK